MELYSMLCTSLDGRGIWRRNSSVQNAGEHFTLNDKERNIIYSHMWPIPGTPLPRSREAWLICIVDKDCAQREMRSNLRKARLAKG